jgi:hypothetical protein
VFGFGVLLPVCLRVTEVVGTSESNSGKMVDHPQGRNHN